MGQKRTLVNDRWSGVMRAVTSQGQYEPVSESGCWRSNATKRNGSRSPRSLVHMALRLVYVHDA
jgi:hypothetical protein